MLKLIHRPSEVRKFPTMGLTATLIIGESSGAGARTVSPVSMELVRLSAMAQMPTPSKETSTTDGLTGAFPAEQRAGDPAGDRHATDRVPVGARRHPDRTGAVRWRRAPRRAGPAPERRLVVAALLRLRAPLAVPAAPHVDDAWVHLADVLDLELQSATGVGQEVDEKDVGVADQVHQHCVAPGRVERQDRCCACLGWGAP